MISSSIPLGLILLLAVADQCVAQTPPATTAAPGRPASQARPRPTGAAEADEPQLTTASFGDWIERCQRVRNSTENIRVCEVAQAIQVEGQNGPVAQLAIGRLKKTDQLRLTLVLPVNVGFPSAPKLSVDGKPPETLELAWRRCVPGGCVADVAVSEPLLALWRAEPLTGRIEAKSGFTQDIQVAFSFKGLGQALDALMREDQ